jgi:hypothetical protein
MDIQKAASYGWDKRSAITMALINLTPEEFRNHPWLDNRLSDDIVPMIYYMNVRERITRDSKINRGIGIYHGHGERGISLDTSPEFKECEGYREFVFKMAEHLGADVFLMPSGIWDCIYGNLWNGSKTIGHKEIADLADYFHKEFVSKHKKGARTRISAEYKNLTPTEILRMGYSPRKVVKFGIEQIFRKQ